MPELLKTLQKKGELKRPRRTMLYGTHGVGKSTFASHAPTPIFIDVEDGLETIECFATPKIESLEEFRAWIGELYSGEHKFQTVVVDTLDFLERLIWAHVCEQGGKNSLEDFGFGKGYKAATNEWVGLLEGFDALREERNMAILLLAHSETQKYENPDTEPYDRYGPRLHKAAGQIIMQWCDEVLFAHHKVYTVAGEKEFGKGRHRGIGGEERIMRCQERASGLAKNRLGMPYEVPFEWAVYAEYLSKFQNKDKAK